MSDKGHTPAARYAAPAWPRSYNGVEERRWWSI